MRPFQSTDEAYYKIKEVEDVPEFICEGIVYYVGSKGNEWLALMKCPCGCKENIHLNLLPEAEPLWRLQKKKGNRPTIYPSIMRNVGCMSHFCIKYGRIIWVRPNQLFF